METNRIDLWPKDIEQQRTASPVALLREQAELLSEKTNNLVQADVINNTQRSARKDFFEFDFFLVGPVLGNYHYLLFSIWHDAALYPVDIDVETRIAQEVSAHFETEESQYDGHLRIVAKSKEQFLEIVKEIFNSTKAKQVIIAILSQSDPYWNRPVKAVNLQSAVLQPEMAV